MVRNCTLANNKAFFGGAIESFGTLTVTGSTFAGNAADNDGGAIHSAVGSLAQAIQNCTFVNNTGPAASAVTTAAAANQWENLTIVDNTGGGVFHVFEVPVTMRNSIVARNSGEGAFTSGGNSSGTFTPESTNNFVAGTAWAGLNPAANNSLNVTPASLKLSTLASNGGPTQTVALLVGSPAINGGIVISGLTADQRGVARSQYSVPDAGPYEFDGPIIPSLVVTTPVDEEDFTSDPNFSTGTSLREALLYAANLPGPQTVTFAPALQGQTVTLVTGDEGPNDDTALRIAGDVTIDGGTGVTITHIPPVKRRLFEVQSQARLTLINLTLTGGDLSSIAAGGAVYNLGDLVVRNCTLANNRAHTGGAIFSNSDLTVSGSTFMGNAADSDGGAILSGSHAGLQTLVNCTFVNNTSPRASAVAARIAVVAQWDHLTVVDNTGAAAFNVEETAVTLRNCVVARNAGEGAITNRESGTGTFSAASTNNFLSGTAWTGVNPVANILNVNPAALRLGGLANIGGPTQTVALLPDSPAINSGAVLSGLTTDQRGLARIVGSAPDAGAVEDTVGDDDPDRDSLTNLAELQFGTNPLALDTDGDGFNDATEIMNGSDPKLATSFPGATRIERVLGVGPARGLDLTGNFLYAVNAGTNGVPGQIGDANFTTDNVTGVTLTATQEIANWAARDFGSATEEDRLEQVFRSIRWDGPSPGVKVDAANLVPGRTYKLQLLFAEAAGYDRAFDVSVNGTKIIPLYNTNLAQGANLKPYAASAIVHTFTAPSATLNVTLSNTTFGSFDPNPILNGFTLEEIPTSAPAPLISPAPGTYTDGSQDLANPGGDGIANLLKYAFNLAPNAGDLFASNTTILPENGNAGVPFIYRDAPGRLFIEFVGRKAATNPGITCIVETGDDLTALQPLSLTGATVVSIDATWERVTITDPTITPSRFGRVRVDVAP